MRVKFICALLLVGIPLTGCRNEELGEYSRIKDRDNAELRNAPKRLAAEEAARPVHNKKPLRILYAVGGRKVALVLDTNGSMSLSVSPEGLTDAEILALLEKETNRLACSHRKARIGGSGYSVVFLDGYPYRSRYSTSDSVGLDTSTANYPVSAESLEIAETVTLSGKTIRATGRSEPDENYIIRCQPTR